VVSISSPCALGRDTCVVEHLRLSYAPHSGSQFGRLSGVSPEQLPGFGYSDNVWL
jgi:hypothetical protein